MELKADEYISYCRLCLEALADGFGLRISETIESLFYDLTSTRLKSNVEASGPEGITLLSTNSYLICRTKWNLIKTYASNVTVISASATISGKN